MKHFIIVGLIKNLSPMNDDILKAHIAYSQKAIEAGMVLVTGVKSDESGGILIMKAESIEKVQDYLNNDPLKINGIQEYEILEFTPHYLNQNPIEWAK